MRPQAVGQGTRRTTDAQLLLSRLGVTNRAKAGQTGNVPMREDCRHFQTRTYSTGEVARFCVLDLAPEAPWRCPANCASYEKDIIDSTFVVGSLVRPEVEAEPDVPEGDASDLLEEAELIVTAGEGEIVKGIERQRQRGARPWWKPWRRKDDGGPNLARRARPS